MMHSEGKEKEVAGLPPGGPLIEPPKAASIGADGMDNPTIKKMVRLYMVQNGYTALAGDECGCTLDDLMPCDEPFMEECVAAYQHKCTEVHPSCECGAKQPTGELCPIRLFKPEGGAAQ